MGRRAKAIIKIERAIAQLENRPGQCLHYAHQTAKILWEHGYPLEQSHKRILGHGRLPNG